jgi:hypothetical protein
MLVGKETLVCHGSRVSSGCAGKGVLYRFEPDAAYRTGTTTCNSKSACPGYRRGNKPDCAATAPSCAASDGSACSTIGPNCSVDADRN